MTHVPSDTPLSAERIDDQIVISGPNSLRFALSLDAARASLSGLQRALDAADAEPETYQKPLG
jgi:hypothetical protein